MSQVGDKNTQIAHADHVIVQKSYNPMIFANSGTVKRSAGTIQNGSWQPSTDYYNLIVYGNDEYMEGALTVGSLLLSKDRVLSYGCTEETKARFERLDNEAITRIKSFPSIFASENHSYGRTDDDHQALLGRINDIGFEDNGIRLYFQTFYPIPQKRLNGLVFELGFVYSSSFNEFNRTHWAIKRVDLLAVLKAAGLNLF